MTTTYESLDPSINRPGVPDAVYTRIQTPEPDYDYESIAPSIGPSALEYEAYTPMQKTEHEHEYENTDAVMPENRAYLSLINEYAQ